MLLDVGCVTEVLFAGGDRFFVSPSRLERGPPLSLARGLKGFHHGWKRDQSIS